MYQVVASDLDGTLLSPDHTLSPYAKETLKLLTARGVNFVFATGRHHVDVGQIRDNLEIKSYMITSNGARVHDTDGNLIFTHNLDRDIATDLFGIVHNNPDRLHRVRRWHERCRDALHGGQRLHHAERAPAPERSAPGAGSDWHQRRQRGT